MLKQFGKSAIFMLFILSLVGCGSDSVTTTPPIAPLVVNSDKLTINQDNSELVIASTIGSIKTLGKKIEDIPRIDLDKIPGFGMASNDIAGVDLDISGIADMCKEGGSAELNSVTSTTLSITFKDCKDKDKILNGKAKLKLNSGLYNLDLTNFSYDNSAYFEVANIIYDERGDRKDFDVFVSSGFVVDNGEQISLRDISLIKVSQNYRLNGNLGTDCLGGVVLLKTVNAIVMENDECPTSGELYAVGGEGSTLGITFNENKSIDTFLNNDIREDYNSCLSLPKYSDVCP